MIVTKFPQLLSVCLCCIALYGCGLDFGVGGASIEGTGNGQPPAPGAGHAGEGGYNLFLSASKEDQCGHVKRKFSFIDPFQYDFLASDQHYILGMGEDHVINVEINLSLTNLNDQAVVLQYPECDVPVELHDRDTGHILFPKQQCDVIKTETLEPDQNRSFKLSYTLSEAMSGVWRLNPNLKIISDAKDSVCETLTLPIQLEKRSTDQNMTLYHVKNE